MDAEHTQLRDKVHTLILNSGTHDQKCLMHNRPAIDDNPDGPA